MRILTFAKGLRKLIGMSISFLSSKALGGREFVVATASMKGDLSPFFEAVLCALFCKADLKPTIRKLHHSKNEMRNKVSTLLPVHLNRFELAKLYWPLR